MTEDRILNVQRCLNDFYLRETAPATRFAEVPRTWAEYSEIFELEREWLDEEEGRVDWAALPTDWASFERWYGDLYERHIDKIRPFFDYLANGATLGELALYLVKEAEVDGRFDDIIALAQVGLGGDPKLAFAENYWDEMGHGVLDGMHTRMFELSGEHVNAIVAEQGGGARMSGASAATLANGNLLLFFALRRQHSARLIGALAILEHTAGWRFAKTVAGMERLGLPESAISYHRLHIDMDCSHGLDILNRVIAPLASEAPGITREIAIGAEIRYNIALDYYAEVRRQMAAWSNRLEDVT